MYNAISEESSPYSSIGGTPFGATPYASSSHLSSLHRGSSGNLASWLAAGPHGGGGLQRQGSGGPQQFPGVSVALKLQSGGAGQAGGEAGGKAAPPPQAAAAVGAERAPLFGGGRGPVAALFGGAF